MDSNPWLAHHKSCVQPLSHGCSLLLLPTAPTTILCLKSLKIYCQIRYSSLKIYVLSCWEICVYSFKIHILSCWDICICSFTQLQFSSLILICKSSLNEYHPMNWSLKTTINDFKLLEISNDYVFYNRLYWYLLIDLWALCKSFLRQSRFKFFMIYVKVGWQISNFIVQTGSKNQTTNFLIHLFQHKMLSKHST